MELYLIEEEVIHFQVVDLVNVLTFGVDMSFSAKIDNKKDILVLGIGRTQGLEHTLTAEKMYSINLL